MSTERIDLKANSKSLFAANSLVEYKYRNGEWVKGVILSSSRGNGIIIDLEISPSKFEQITLYHSKAMTYCYIDKTLKQIGIPQQLLSIGTNIEYKYNDKEWKNCEIVNIYPTFNEIEIKVRLSMDKDIIITISRSDLIMKYAFYKTIKLTNWYYPSWITLDQHVLVKKINNNDFNDQYSSYKVLEFHDGEFIKFKKIKKIKKITQQNIFDDDDDDEDDDDEDEDEDIFIIKHEDIKNIKGKKLETDKYKIKRDGDGVNLLQMVYEWQIKSGTINKRKDLLCNGFIRKYCDTYIYRVIIELIAFYLSDIMEDIKNAQFKQPFFTSPIMIKGMEWFLEFYPNGLSTCYQGYFEVFLCLKKLPNDLQFVKLNWKLKLNEMNMIYTPYCYNFKINEWNEDQFNKGTTLWRRTGDRDSQKYRKKLPKINIKDLKSITFRFDIHYISILDKKNRVMKYEKYYRKPMLR